MILSSKEKIFWPLVLIGAFITGFGIAATLWEDSAYYVLGGTVPEILLSEE